MARGGETFQFQFNCNSTAKSRTRRSGAGVGACPPNTTGARHRSGREGSPNRSRDRKGALLALPIDLTLPYGRGSDWSTPYARILSIGRHLRKALLCVAHPNITTPLTWCVMGAMIAGVQDFLV